MGVAPAPEVQGVRTASGLVVSPREIDHQRVADWSGLTRRLESADAGRLELPFTEIERLIGGRLPPSSQYPAFWSNSSSYAKAWKRAGFESTRRGVPTGHMGFVRIRTLAPVSAAVGPTPELGQKSLTTGEVVLVGCVKTKGHEASRARDLYLSPLFERRRRYAESSGQPWYILSAEHGLLDPDSIIEPYDVYLADQSSDYRQAWGEWVAAKLTRVRGPIDGLVIEIHAGMAYVDAIEEPLRRRGAVLLTPLAGLRRGEQLAWYDGRGEETPLPEQVVPSVPIDQQGFQDLVILDGPHEIGPFTFRWPTETEEFDYGWDLTVEAAGRRHRVRHGMGARQVYGARRRHSVTFVDDWAAAEGVAPDDYQTSGCLISLIKDHAGRLIRPGEPVPTQYDGFLLISHAEQIVSPYSRDALAVRLHSDDITSWVGYALTRLSVRRADGAGASQVPATQLRPNEPRASAPPAVVVALLRYGQAQAPAVAGQATFTPHPEANALILDNSFAFLLAVVFDQGIPAERAWRAPYDLMRRLGHLDPARMLADPEGVRTAVGQPPVLHRYREKLPGWLIAAARIVLHDYAGETSRIWNDHPTARQLQQRLDRFPGIGQKKAAMAVEILNRDLGVPIRELDGSDIAYDVHVRRVLLRTGLAEYDDLEHMIDVARRAYPERPGAIDMPAWLVGRQWCHAGFPDCPACVLRDVCPKDIDRANAVRGA
ncbi:MAG: DUF6884 domain-containing protein [Streptosporangiaceae bacterium]